MFYIYAMINNQKVLAEEVFSNKSSYFVRKPRVIRNQGDGILEILSYPAVENFAGEVELKKLHVAQRFLPSSEELGAYYDADRNEFKKVLNG